MKLFILPLVLYYTRFYRIWKLLTKQDDDERIPHEFNDNIEEWDKCLFSLRLIKKGELVASFLLEDSIDESKHYLRNSSVNANCQLVGRDVYANQDIPSETELTLYYHGILL